MPSAYELVEYFSNRNAIEDTAPIVFFEGHEVGEGPDGEPLVIPTRVIAWFWGWQLDEGILEHEDDPAIMSRLVQRFGSKRRNRGV